MSDYYNSISSFSVPLPSPKQARDPKCQVLDLQRCLRWDRSGCRDFTAERRKRYVNYLISRLLQSVFFQTPVLSNLYFLSKQSRSCPFFMFFPLSLPLLVPTKISALHWRVPLLRPGLPVHWNEIRLDSIFGKKSVFYYIHFLVSVTCYYFDGFCFPPLFPLFLHSPCIGISFADGKMLQISS